MSRLTLANAIERFAKEHGFPKASVFFTHPDSDYSNSTANDAVDNMDDGQSDEFQISIYLGDVKLKNMIIDGHSNAFEMDGDRTLLCTNCKVMADGGCAYSRFPSGCQHFAANPPAEPCT